MLSGKLLATCLDLPDEPLSHKAIGIIKQLIGDDAMKGEIKRENPFTFYLKPLLLCAGNYPIRIPKRDKELALLNRMVVIPFSNPVSPDDEEQHFFERLLDERAYIISRAIEALEDLAARNFQPTRVALPDEYDIRDGRDGFEPVSEFFNRRCVISEFSSVSTAKLFEAFREFCESNGEVLLTMPIFSQFFKEIAGEIEAVEYNKNACGKDIRGYRGIRLS